MNTNAANADEPLWLCLHFENLPLEVFARGAEHESAPIVITEGGRVCRLNEAAEAIGIEPGSTMNTALNVSESLASFERDVDKERANLERLAQWAYQLTPNVSVALPDSLLLEAGSCLKLWGGLDALLARIDSGLARLGFIPTIGQGRTPLAAHLASVSRLQGIATRSSIGQLPVHFLAVDDVTLGSMSRMGIHTVDRLLALPTASLSRRFGVYFSDYLGRLTGAQPDPRKFVTAEPHFFSEITFLADVTDLNALIFPIRRLLSELGEFLTGRQLFASHLSWKLSHRSHEPVAFSVSVAEPERDPAVFLPLTQLKLDRLPEIPEVDSLSLTVREFFTASAKAGDNPDSDPFSGDLFQGTGFRQRDTNPAADRSRTNALLNTLSARLGPDSCFGLLPADDHRPEKAWKTVRALELVSSRRRLQQVEIHEQSPRPTFLLSRPRELSVRSGMPRMGNRQLTLMRGPERIDFGWWDRPAIDQVSARDYYIARDDDGAMYWIFEYPAGASTTGWYLHGIFS